MGRAHGAVGATVACALVVLVLATGVLVARDAVSCGAWPFQPRCYVALQPGPTRDALGFVEVTGATSYAASGELRLTTVAVDEDLDLGEWWRARRSDVIDTVPREVLYPPGRDVAEVDERNAEQMSDSQRVATSAALDALGGGDLEDDREDLEIDIDAGAIGGPSAGLMFALAVVELLDAEDLTGDTVVAGTGTLDADGRIGPIGGITQKVVGGSAGGRPADVFLVPVANLAEARRAPVDEDVLLVPVASLEGAIAALDAIRAGRDPSGALALTAKG